MNIRKFIFLPVVLSLFDGNTNVTTDVGLSGEMKKFYDKTLIKLAEPAPMATTTTVTAAPTGPTYTPAQTAAAKKEACDAVATADGPITSSQRDFYAARLDRNSPQYQQMLSNWQTVSAIEIEYTRAHLTPATPPAVADAINADLASIAALVDANTRGVPDDQANVLIDKLKATGAQVSKVCEE